MGTRPTDNADIKKLGGAPEGGSYFRIDMASAWGLPYPIILNSHPKARSSPPVFSQDT